MDSEYFDIVSVSLNEFDPYGTAKMYKTKGFSNIKKRDYVLVNDSTGQKKLGKALTDALTVTEEDKVYKFIHDSKRPEENIEQIIGVIRMIDE